MVDLACGKQKGSDNFFGRHSSRLFDRLRGGKAANVEMAMTRYVLKDTVSRRFVGPNDTSVPFRLARLFRTESGAQRWISSSKRMGRLWHTAFGSHERNIRVMQVKVVVSVLK